jgi:hypothetical protein
LATAPSRPGRPVRHDEMKNGILLGRRWRSLATCMLREKNGGRWFTHVVCSGTDDRRHQNTSTCRFGPRKYLGRSRGVTTSEAGRRRQSGFPAMSCRLGAGLAHDPGRGHGGGYRGVVSVESVVMTWGVAAFRTYRAEMDVRAWHRKGRGLSGWASAVSSHSSPDR